ERFDRHDAVRISRSCGVLECPSSGTQACRVPGLLQCGTPPCVVGGPYAAGLRQWTRGDPCRPEPCALGLPLQGPRPAPSRRLTTNSRPTGVGACGLQAYPMRTDDVFL